MIFGYGLLLTALILSAVAEFYSIMGLVAIFSAAVIPVIIMGASLGLGKIVATVWLHNNWNRAGFLFKAYLVPAVMFLMLLTSMGIFGYLSKAHSDQSLVSGDSMAKVAIYDDKIRTAKDNIDANRKALKQMDEAVDQVMGRSSDEKGAEKAVGIRRSQQKERARLQSEIATEQKTIAALGEEAAPLRAEFRKIESEVGPIKYIAALIYGDNPDDNLLEKAVRFVIIMIVLVFDPLALTLILAANKQFEWARQGRGGFVHDDQAAMAIIPPKEENTRSFTEEEVAALDKDPHPPGWMFDISKHKYLTEPFVHFKNLVPIVAKKPGYEPDDGPLTEEQVEQLNESVDADGLPQGEVISKQELFPDLGVYDDQRLVSKFDKMDLERPGDYLVPSDQDNDHEEDDNHEEDENIKDAIKKWKSQNPDDTIKNQRYKFMRGEIVELPWMGLVADNISGKGIQSGFGISFPEKPTKGDVFVRVDIMPSVLYKYNGANWIAVDKNLSDSYTYDLAYIEHLIGKISTGEYDPDLLSDSEREQVEHYLQTTQS
jgi:hypothetical protein